MSTHMHRVWERGVFSLISSSTGSFQLRRARKSFLLWLYYIALIFLNLLLAMLAS